MINTINDRIKPIKKYEISKIETINKDDIVKIEVSQQVFNSKPTTDDIRRVRKVLRDFGCKNATIPNYPSLTALLNYQRKKIDEQLNSPPQNQKKQKSRHCINSGLLSVQFD